MSLLGRKSSTKTSQATAAIVVYLWGEYMALQDARDRSSYYLKAHPPPFSMEDYSTHNLDPQLMSVLDMAH
jgi:hypothetical protein